jgi:hypothetical protein
MDVWGVPLPAPVHTIRSELGPTSPTYNSKLVVKKLFFAPNFFSA